MKVITQELFFCSDSKLSLSLVTTVAQSDVFDTIYILSFLQIFKKLKKCIIIHIFLSYFVGHTYLYSFLYTSAVQ